MMIKRILLTLIISVGLSIPVFSQGFWKKLKEKAENVGSELIVRKGAQKAENAIDKTGNGKKTDKKNSNKDDDEPSTKGDKKYKALKTNSKFDFVPGEKIIFADNFEQDVIGEFPLKWFTKGSGEVVTVDGFQGKWAMMTAGSLLSPIIKIPESFTYEFDVIINLSPTSSAVYPGLGFELFDRGDGLKRVGYDTYSLKNVLFFKTGFHAKFATLKLDSRENAKQKLTTDVVQLPGFESNYGSAVHVSISVQKERLRMWFDNQKVLDVPKAVAINHNFNQLMLTGAKTGEGEPAFYFSNFKIASGVPDTRAKFLEEGRYVTNGILFDTGSDTIKPASYGIIKEIAAAIKENAIKVKIIGHTDNDGSPEANLALSKKRSEAVKKVLVDEFDIAEASLETDGKGASQPVSDNKTAIGKAENRRVEFIKL